MHVSGVFVDLQQVISRSKQVTVLGATVLRHVVQVAPELVVDLAPGNPECEPRGGCPKGQPRRQAAPSCEVAYRRIPCRVPRKQGAEVLSQLIPGVGLADVTPLQLRGELRLSLHSRSSPAVVIVCVRRLSPATQNSRKMYIQTIQATAWARFMAICINESR